MKASIYLHFIPFLYISIGFLIAHMLFRFSRFSQILPGLPFVLDAFDLWGLLQRETWLTDCCSCDSQGCRSGIQVTKWGLYWLVTTWSGSTCARCSGGFEVFSHRFHRRISRSPQQAWAHSLKQLPSILESGTGGTMKHMADAIS